MWVDHLELRRLSHAALTQIHAQDESFFEEYYAQEHEQRKLPVAQKGRWQPGFTTGSVTESSLQELIWSAVSELEWEERLRDGRPYRLLLPWETELLWYPQFLSQEDANDLEHKVADGVTMYHPTLQFQKPSGFVSEVVSRKGQALVCDDFTFSTEYANTGSSQQRCVHYRTQNWSNTMMRQVEAASRAAFNAIWFNCYRDGTVAMQWHADTDAGLGPNPVIASLTLGATRDFCLKSKSPWHGGSSGKAGSIYLSFPLFHGSLLVMGRNSQVHWLHAVPAMEGVNCNRTNLTFRFYAHKSLEPVQGGAVAPQLQFISSDLESSSPFAHLRIRVVPLGWSTEKRLRPVLLDAPLTSTTVGEFLARMRSKVLPENLGGAVLALSPMSEDSLAALRDEFPLLDELLRHGWRRTAMTSEVLELFCSSLQHKVRGFLFRV